MKRVQQPPCPFWKATTVDQRGVDPNAPAPLDPNARTPVSKGREMLAYHGKFGPVSSFAIAQLLPIAANKGLVGKLRGVLTQTWVPNELSGGILDKALDTGLLRGKENGEEVVGRFSPEALDKMYAGPHSSEYTLASGEKVRGLTADQLTAFVNENAEELGANFIHKAMAHFEMKNLLLEHFGTEVTDASGAQVRIVEREAAELFYRFGLMPHAELREAMAQLHPTATGAGEASGGCPFSGARAALQGARDACPYSGANLPEDR